MPCQHIILQVVSAIGNLCSSRGGDGCDMRLFFLLFLFPSAFLLILQIAKTDQFLLNLAGCFKISLVQLFKQSFKIADLIL